MLQNAAKVAKRPDSTTNFDNIDASYYYSTRPSIDSVNLHPFQLDVEGKNQLFPFFNNNNKNNTQNKL